MAKAKHPFATEAELCAAFIAWAQRGGEWVAYPETEGWDILLVRKADGFQVGIHGKMQFNMKVLSQALEGSGCYWREEGPDCRAVLVPDANGDAEEVCHALGLTLLRWTTWTHWEGAFTPELPGARRGIDYPLGRYWPEWCPTRRHPLPEFVPDVVAGSPAPVQLTKWKVAAIRVVARLRLRGHVTRADFKELGIDNRRWLAPPHGYLDPAEDGRFVASPRLPDFEAQHPVVFPQVLAEETAKLAEVRP